MLDAFFIAPLNSLNGLSELLLKASPLILIACGLAVGFRANVWNIGAEGQLIMGAIAATGVGLFYPDPESVLLLPLMLLAGMAAGIAWAAILHSCARMNTSEILVTLMLTYVASLFLSWLVHGPWRDPAGFNYPQTALLPAAALFEPFDYAYRVNLRSSSPRSSWSRCGCSPIAASSATRWRSAARRRSPPAMPAFANPPPCGSGCLPEAPRPGRRHDRGGRAARTAVAEISPGYGFAAIIVAFIGRLNAFGIVLAGLLMSLLFLGGETVQVTLGLPSALTRVFQGILLFFLLAADFFIFYRVRRIGGHR